LAHRIVQKLFWDNDAHALGSRCEESDPLLAEKGEYRVASSCGSEGQAVEVTALLPKTNEAELSKKAEIEVESTVAARPTFLIHVPQTSAKNAEFMMRKKISDQEEEIVYEQVVALPETPGIVSISLPADQAALEVDQLYNWTFQVVCDPTDRNKDLTVQGAVKRIELDSSLANQLQNAEPRDRPAIYAEAEIWTDALSTLADLRKANPNNQQLQDDWNDLLSSVGLDKVAQATVIGSLNGVN